MYNVPGCLSRNELAHNVKFYVNIEWDTEEEYRVYLRLCVGSCNMECLNLMFIGPCIILIVE